jgi:methyl-accepting chemotaxis protein
MAKSIEGQTVEQATQSSSVRGAMLLVMREVEDAARATADHKAAADRIADAIERLGQLAPELSAQATDQARGAQAVRSGTSQVAAMTDELRSVQREQTAASHLVLTSVDDVLRAQEGVDAALKALRTS